MAQYRGRKTPRMTAALEKLFDHMTSSYCPECGSRSSLADPPAALRDAGEGDSVCFACPQCGPFYAERTSGGWKVAGTDIPYIMNAETNSATLLHRFDPSAYNDKTEADTEHVRLLCETAIDYRYVGDDGKAMELIDQALDIALGSLTGVSKDDSSMLFGCIHLFFTMVSEGKVSAEDTDRAVSRILDAIPSMDRLMSVGVLSMCAEASVRDGGEPDARIIGLYEDLISSEPAVNEDPDRPYNNTYWEGLALVAVMLGRDDDVIMLMDRVVAEWKRIASSVAPNESDVDGLMMFVLTLYDGIRDDTFDRLIDGLYEVADMCRETVPYMGDSLTMVRYEHRLDNGLHPYDRTQDLDGLIEKYAEPKDAMEASIIVKSLVHRAQESEDFDDALADMGRALDIIVSSKLYDTDFRDLVMDMAVRYMDLADDDKKVQRSILMKLKRMGITRDALKAWRKRSRRE